LLRAWQRGRTGIPLVDAGMRELWHTGWMHNRVRMVVASLLTKNLRYHWLEGARWFWDTLVDADLANNTQGWQWTAGSGADAAPYFRIFNPMSQGERFDPEGEYVRRHVPELGKVPASHIHAPWTLRPIEQQHLGIANTVYARPLIDLAATRQAALDAYQRMRAR
jgi:deoxyribodipyrimidine photo-lyase